MTTNCKNDEMSTFTYESSKHKTVTIDIKEFLKATELCRDMINKCHGLTTATLIIDEQIKLLGEDKTLTMAKNAIFRNRMLLANNIKSIMEKF